jgi:effector-binding domain-containing protein
MKKSSPILVLLFCLTVSLFAQTQEPTPPVPPAPPTPPSVPDIQVKEMQPFTYYAVEMTGSYDQHGTAFGKLYEQTYAQGMSAYEAALAIYYNDPANTPEEQLKWEVGLPLDEVKELQAPLVVKKWEFPLVAAKIYEGPFDQQLGVVYGQMYQWIGDNGYAPNGPMLEKYIDMPTQNENGVWVGKMEIIIPVQKIQK